MRVFKGPLVHVYAPSYIKALRRLCVWRLKILAQGMGFAGGLGAFNFSERASFVGVVRERNVVCQ